jgi:hypothetical protein
LFNCLQLVEHVHETRGNSGATLSQKAGARVQATRGAPRAALSREVAPEPWGCAAAPELH